jgi:cytidylate kinase
MRKIIIAIDGYSSCGKSTTAKAVAAVLGYGYVDTGAMYRATTLYMLSHYIDLTNPKQLEKSLLDIQIHFQYNNKTLQNETYLNGLNVEKEIRQMYISEKVSEVSAVTEVRRSMVAQQQRMGKKRGVVMDGRDIGTVVFPDAEVKIFMTADLNIRAWRRQQELLARNEMVNIDVIKENLAKRDYIDANREEGPLRKAADAVELDTSFMTIDEQVDFVVGLCLTQMFEKKISEGNY